jgi:hypothetical protein
MPWKRPQVLGADLNRSESSQAGVSRLYGTKKTLSGSLLAQEQVDLQRVQLG